MYIELLLSKWKPRPNESVFWWNISYESLKSFPFQFLSAFIVDQQLYSGSKVVEREKRDREREREKEKEREIEKDRERQRETDRETDRDSETERQKETDTETERDRQRQRDRERRRSPKTEKLRAFGKVIWAKASTLTFIIFLLLKSKAKEYRKIFIRPLKMNGNKVATSAAISHGCFTQNHVLWWQWKVFMLKLRGHLWTRRKHL